MAYQDVDGWGYLVRMSDGERVSQGTRFPDPVPDGFELVEVPKRLDELTHEWDPSTKALRFVPDTERADQIDAAAASLASEAARLRGA